MKIIETPSQLTSISEGRILSIGNFDGVHLGHQEIIKTAKQAAEEKQTELMLMTFEPHPIAVLHPDSAPNVLTPLNLKAHLLAQLGVDTLVVIKDSRELLSLCPEDFVNQFLVKNIRPSIVVEGDDFNFGEGRKGNIDTLTHLGQKSGFEVLVVDPKQIELTTGKVIRVSSTIIRYMLEGGHVADAAVALGRPYRLAEKIIPGRGVGKQLGFPTLNMKIPKQLIPAEGVYAGFVAIGDTAEEVTSSKQKIPAVYSIGQTRTYGDDFPLLIEAHLLEENANDIDKKFIAMDFVGRIRSQHKFKTPEKLSEQIAKDCEKAQKILGSKNV